jgi:hypothetical protein
MAVSQNGWSANQSSLIASYTIPGTGVKIALRKGDASVVLLHFAQWYNAHIEPLTKADTGGYNPRTISGSSILSNHASGTAMDLRWNRHPRGARGTFTAAQKAAVHAQLKFYEGLIRWGEDYASATIDGMHFEINKGTAATKTVADKIRNAQKPKPQENDVELDDKYGDAAWPNRTVRNRFGDDAKVRDVLWGDETGTKAAKLSPNAPLAKLIATPAKVDALAAKVDALTKAVEALAAKAG